MFEINGEYANRKGKYVVLSIDGRIMHVRYEDGSHAELNMGIQDRIWQNIKAEIEAAEAKATRSAQALQRTGKAVKHYIKSISLPAPDELMFPGWQEQVLIASHPLQATRIQVGDRIIYYAIETDTFIAVATITGDAFIADPKDYFFKTAGQEAYFFPVDIDVAVFRPDQGIARDTVELEDYPDLKKQLSMAENFLSVSEDDFELMAELLTEESEEADEDDDKDDDDLDEEDEE